MNSAIIHRNTQTVILKYNAKRDRMYLVPRHFMSQK